MHELLITIFLFYETAPVERQYARQKRHARAF